MERKEIKIPVFSVLKKGSILKNIILNSPLLEIQEDDERILIGRHPDCHIVLDHPSISRFHLEVQVKPFLQKLFVVDRSSVHGTWVSGAKIEPCVPVELTEGDTLRFGVSTRVYRLHWLLPRDVLEMGNPLGVLIEEKEDAHQDEGLGSSKERWIAEIPSAPPLPESISTAAIDKIFLKELEVNENLTAEMPLVKDARSSSSLLSRRKKSVGLLCIPNGRSEDVMKEKHCHVLSANVDGNEVKDDTFSSRGISEGQTTEEKFDYSMDDLALEVFYEQMFQESRMQRSSSNWTGYLNVVDDKYCLDGEVTDIVKQEQCILDHCKTAAGEDEGGDKEEEEEEAFVSDKENMTPVVSNGRRSQKTRCGIQRSPFKAIAALNLEDEFLSDGELKPVQEQPILKICENTTGEEVEEEEEVEFVSDKENMTPIVSTGHKSQKTRFGVQRSPFKAIAALSLEDEFLSDGELKPVQEQPILKICENTNGEEVDFVSDKENRTTIVSTGQKSQKTRFGVQRSPTKAIAALNLEDEFLSYGKLNPGQSVLREGMKVLEEKQETIVLEKENMTPVETRERRSEKSCMKIQKSSSNAIATLSVVVDSSYPDQENWTPESTKDLKLKNYTSENILRRNLETAYFDKENWTSEVSMGQKLKRRAEKFTMDENEEPASGSNKENLTPDSSRALKSRKSLSTSHTKIEEQIMKKRVERIPFQSLLENSPMKACSSVGNNKRDANKAPLSSKQSDGTSGDNDQSIRTLNQRVDQMHNVVEEKNWNIVADTSCFLNEESRRSLQLLEGLKGTHLIIPMMVIRELDCMKQRERWYQKTSKASSSLQWIKDCMVRTSWWIHVQNSSETLPVPQTPPASPRLQFAENSMAFGGLSEILSPTAEDHILDCALLFKSIKTDGHLVLISDNTTLKIKAMAEGLLCETPVEFRDSLVNPFSNRFLWVDSSPRGSTWSLSEEMSFSQNYYHQLPNTRKGNMVFENAKGLKLILLHNSHYRQANAIK